MKIKAYIFYIVIILWLLLLKVLLSLSSFGSTGLGVTLSFLTIIFLPGFLLYRLLKVQSQLAKYLYIIGFGFGFYFLINFFALVLNLTISQIGFVNLFLVSLLFLISFIKDWQEIWEIDFSYFKEKDPAKWVVRFFVLIALILAFLGLDAQSDRLIGDGWFHLALLQKIVSGGGLSPYNLWVVKSEVLNPVYSFPVWHIFIGQFSNILGIPIFTALKQSLLPLFIISMIVWFSLISLIFKNYWITTVCFLSLILIFLKDNIFYYLVALPSPDSFNRLLLLPLILGLTVNYLFEKTPKILNITLISLLVIFLGLIHFTQVIYLVVIWVVLGLVLLIFFVKEPLKRLGLLMGGLAILILPYLLIFQRGIFSSFLMANAAAFTGDKVNFKTYLGANIIYRYAILSLPVIVLFLKKQLRLGLLFSIAVGMLLIYWPYLGLRPLFLKYFGAIFVDRSLAIIPHFIYFGFLLFFIILGINYLLVFVLRKIHQKAIWFANIILVIFTLLAVFGLPANFVDKNIFSETNILFIDYFWLIFALIILLVLVIYIMYRKKEFILPKPKENLNFALLIILFFVFLSTPYFVPFKETLTKNPNGSIVSNRLTNNASDITYFGGQKTIDFWQSKSKEVFLTDAVTLAQMILLYSDNYAAEYPYSIKEFSQSNKFYDESLSLDERLEILDSLQVNYIIVRHAEDTPFYENNSNYFEKVFENTYEYKGGEKELIVFKYLNR
ncbi:MAG: hypothetical protein WCV58_01360 [Patescibacteria group bacterium]